MKKLKYLTLVFVLSVSVFLLTTPLRSYPFGFPYSSTVGFIVSFYLTLFCLKNFGRKLNDCQLLIALILGLWLLEIPIRIIDFESTLGSLPDSLIRSLGVIFGYLYWHLKNPLNILSVVLGCLITVFMFYQGYDYWFNKLNYGTFTGQVIAYNLPAKFEAFDQQKNLITDNNFQNKVVLLDFWTTTCGICFEKFPQVQGVYNRYEGDSMVTVLAVNTPIEEDKPNQAFNDIIEIGYNFPVVITKDENLAEKYGVTAYPTTFVINQNSQIVYKGDIEGAVKMVDELKSNSQ